MVPLLDVNRFWRGKKCEKFTPNDNDGLKASAHSFN